jgi:hypothetical protein
MAVKPRIFELHIDELVLNGFARRDRLSIGDAIERELTRLITESGLIVTPLEVEHLNAGTLKTPVNAKPASIGAEVAGKVYHGIHSASRQRTPR